MIESVNGKYESKLMRCLFIWRLWKAVIWEGKKIEIVKRALPFGKGVDIQKMSM